MTKRHNLYETIVYIVMALFLAFTYLIMNSLELGESEVGSYPGIISLAIFVLAVLALMVRKEVPLTGFTVFWIVWSVWLFLIINIFGLSTGGISNYFRAIFCPMSFVLFYCASSHSDKVEKIAFGGFFLIYLLAYYLNIQNISRYQMLIIGEETGISNLGYWCLSVVPILVCSKRRWFQAGILVTMLFCVIITGKRSSSIAMMIILPLYYFVSQKSVKNSKKTGNFVLFVLGAFVVFIIVSRYFSGTFQGVVERFERIDVDEGSGRIPLYNDVFAVLEQNSIGDWILGRGYGSIVLSRHTNAHNDALQMLFEYGIIGLFVYIAMFIYAIKRARVLRRNNSEYYLGYAISIVIFIVLGMVSDLVVFNSYFAFICAFWGIVESKLVQNKLIRR